MRLPVKAKGKIATYSAALTAARTTYETAHNIKQKYEAKRNYVISVDEDFSAYDDIMVWLQANTHGKRFRMVHVFNHVGLVYDAMGTTVINIDDHRIKVSLNKPERSAGIMAMGELDMLGRSMKDELLFYCPSQDAAVAVEKWMQSLVIERSKKETPVRVFSIGNWGGWDAKNLPMRDINSVFLPPGVKEGLLTDFEKFRASEEKYRTLGMPWHYGILLYGPPGNGKSSLAASLAHFYKMNIFNMPLSGLDSDKKLAEALTNVANDSILLIEDIDIFTNSLERKQEKNGPTLAGLLNGLDGVATPHGLVTIITTNNKSALDPALIRAGRVSYSLELKAPVTSQIEALFESIYGEPLGVEPKNFESMAAVSEIMKSNLDSAEDARLEIKS